MIITYLNIHSNSFTSNQTDSILTIILYDNQNAPMKNKKYKDMYYSNSIRFLTNLPKMFDSTISTKELTHIKNYLK